MPCEKTILPLWKNVSPTTPTLLLPFLPFSPTTYHARWSRRGWSGGPTRTHDGATTSPLDAAAAASFPRPTSPPSPRPPSMPPPHRPTTFPPSQPPRPASATPLAAPRRHPHCRRSRPGSSRLHRARGQPSFAAQEIETPERRVGVVGPTFFHMGKIVFSQGI